jgi:regulator of sigma E protease
LKVRTAVVLAGPLFNFLFAIFAYWLILVSGDTGMRPLIGEVEPESIAANAGFAEGDEILAVGDRKTPTWETAVYALLAESLGDTDLPVRVRDDQRLEKVRWLEARELADVTEDGQVLERIGLSPKRPLLSAVIGEVIAGEAAARAGLQTGDELLSVDGVPLKDWGAWVAYVRAHPDQKMSLDVKRDGLVKPVQLTTSHRVDDDGTLIGRIGASVYVPKQLLDEYRTEIRLGPVDAAGAAVKKTWDLSVLMLRMLGKMLIGEASVKNLSGPISIAESAGRSASYGLVYFLKFLAVVSISLGVLNLLPVPILDGGHLLYFLIEALKGSPLSESAQIQGQRVGILILLGLMTLAFYVDISRLLGYSG